MLRDLLKKRRDATRVIHDILLLADSGVVKTQIVYQANLNFTLAKSYLDFLVSKGYLVFYNTDTDDLTHYSLTEKGQRLLKMLSDLEVELAGLFRTDRRQLRLHGVSVVVGDETLSR